MLRRKRFDRTLQGRFFEMYGNGEVPTRGADRFDFLRNGFKAVVLAHDIERLVHDRVEVIGDRNGFAGERNGFPAEGHVDRIRLRVLVQFGADRFARFGDAHAADADAVDRNAIQHGGTQKDRVKLFAVRVGRRRDKADVFGIYRYGRFRDRFVVGIENIGACDADHCKQSQKQRKTDFQLVCHM